ncbi:PREDICTED: uncharacterized protein LOC108575238 [Habropoda laboriosa]|uniref:uncharacterized protein LOC108575238 n=1 Tax=Habropoda laboriosa TaxID=597456 RepID=UPI00083CBDE2|nr:PREDICTED: uncharacterized protein LOC108575238 [Habropoda laboriosa]
MSSLLTVIIPMIFQYNSLLRKKGFIKLFKFIKHDYERLINLPEYNVLYSVAIKGRRNSLVYIFYVCISATMYFTLSIAVVIFEELNKNRTEPRQTLYPVEYHIDSEKYFYLITAHCYASTVLLLLQTVVHDTMYIVLVQHGCALFAVTGYCLKGAHCLDSKGLLKDDDFEQYKNRCYTLSEQKKIYQRLVLGIKEHKRAIEYTKLLHAVFSECLFIVLMLNIISLSINGVQALINLHEIQTSIRLILWEIGLFIHLFWLCLPGQRLTDFSERVYYDVLHRLPYRTSPF